MRVKTEDLSGDALNWAISEIEGGCISPFGPNHYSTTWSDAGPIIERERINLMYLPRQKTWIASLGRGEGVPAAIGHGSTLLIAGMRAYAITRHGDTIEVADDLLGARP